ncbi:MAG: ATP-binding protein [Bacteroidaceae bacterium]|nr:ATP-binding protein [Bacteroidales bacterium]MBR0272607.1 ATP-binding protein [Bacteroidaceae bacterium]
MDDYKLIPYGISDFAQLRDENKYYVDKTMYLPRMETAGNFLFLIRPRRFGKSLFMSMMQYYYDVNRKDDFERLFGGLWIADHTTSLQGRFEVLRLDFSQVSGNMELLQESFNEYSNLMLDDFIDRYAAYYSDGYAEKGHALHGYMVKLGYIANMARREGHKLYLIIDEYDNFTNNVLNEKGEAVYHALTHASGFYRDVFKLFKGNFDRILMVGVSSVTLDDVTSGYNIATNITMDPRFNMMLGFSETEVREMIRYYQSVGAVTADEETLVKEMMPWYDNYCFSEDSIFIDPKLFNSDMVLYYMQNIIAFGKAPKNMIDNNTRTDYMKMNKLLQLDKLEKVESYNGVRRGMLYKIAQDGEILENVNLSFPAYRMADKENFVSLLFFYGMLTVGEPYGAKTRLIIPNNNVRLQYYDYLLRAYQEIAAIDVSEISNAYDEAALRGNWEPMIKALADAYEQTTSVRQLIEGEYNLQGFMNAYLSLNPYYFVAPEMELAHGYCDFFLMPNLRRWPMVKHSFILELKYLKTDATEAETATQWREAEAQIRRYAAAPRVRQMTDGTVLHPIVMQFRGYRMERFGEVK